MAIHTKREKGDVQAGVIGLRAPDGSIAKTVKIYTEAPGGEKKRAGRLSDSEKSTCDGIVRDMAAAFGQYVEGVKALEQKRRGK